METFDWFAWVILPLLVFIARFVDVTLGTMRIILPWNENSLAYRLHEQEYSVTFMDGHGGSGNPVALVYTVGELRSVREGIFPVRSTKLMGAAG